MNAKSPAAGNARALLVAFSLCVAPDAFPQEATSNPPAEPAPEAAAVAPAATEPATAAAAQADPASAGTTGSPESGERNPAASSSPADAPPAAPNVPDAPGGAVVVGRRSRTEATSDRTASATIVSAERFAGEAKGVAELVATAPGVAVSDYGGLGRLATASIRGSTADGVLVLLDGIPLNSAFGGGVDLSSIPRAWIDRIEVVRGVEGAHYGAGALGGVVNIITRRASPDTWSAELTGGSFGTVTASADRGARLGDATLLFSAGIDATRGEFPYRFDRQQSISTNALEDFTRADNGAVRGGGLAKLVVPLGRIRLDALAELSAGKRELPPEPGHDAEGSRDWQQDARALLAARAVAPGPLAGLSFAGRGSLRLDAFDTRLAALGPDPRRQRGGVGSAAAEALLEHRGGLLRVEGGADSEWLDAGDVSGSHDRPGLHAAGSEEARLASGRIRIAPAVRVDKVGPFVGTSGKLGVSVALGGPVSIRASGGRTFRPPSFAELYLQQGLAQPNADLQPEKGTGADASLVVDGPLGVASVGGHATYYRDLIIWEPASFGRLKPFNTGKALVSGLEAEAATAPLRTLAGLSVSAAYTWLFSENLRGPDEIAGNDLPRRPRHRLYARTGIAPGRFAAHVEAHYVGRQWQDARNVIEVSPVLLWNAGAAVSLDRSRSFTLQAEVRNVLDDRTLQDPIGNPLPGRMVLVSLRAGAARAEVTP